MKKLLSIFLLSIVYMAANAQVQEGSVQASGLTCAMCSNAVNKALEALPFVESVETDLNASAFAMKFKKDAEVSFDAIKNAVEDAGFSVAGLKIKASFQPVQIEKDAHIQLGKLNLHFLDVPKQELKGAQWVNVVDKNFVTAKEYKKFSKSTAMACYETGVMESCCKNGEAKQRIYHVTL